MKANRHRYIFCGEVNGTDKVSDFRLLYSCKRNELRSFVRVNIPDDMELRKSISDTYSTVDHYEEQRTLDDVGWDCYIFYKNKWRKFNDLKKYQPCYWFRVLEYIYGLDECEDVGWTDDSEHYVDEWHRRFRGEEVKTNIPKFKEDKIGLELPINLRDLPCDFPHEDNWLDEYKRLKTLQEK